MTDLLMCCSAIERSHALPAALEVTPRSASLSSAKAMTTVPFNSRTKFASFALRTNDSRRGFRRHGSRSLVMKTMMSPHRIERSRKAQRERLHHDNEDSRQETESTTFTSALQVWRISLLMYVTRLLDEAHRKFLLTPPR